MCGICGELRLNGDSQVEASVLAAMNGAQRHRGPDASGVWIRGPVGFGHQRLAILDVAGSPQPMTDPSGAITVTFNGEIYNYLELREALQARSRRFLTTGDTEVLLQAYLEWGPAMIERLSGMFAFGLYDARCDRLFAARDPMGQKPWIYYTDAQGLIFASELTALLRHPRVPRRIDRDAIARYLVSEHVPPPATALEGVRKLPPGHALLYHRAAGRLEVWPYWDLVGPARPADDRPLTVADEKALIEQLRASVARHLRSDVPVGVYLSGGVDSTALALLACDLVGGRNVPTFTVAHPDRSFDESAAARRLAQRLGTQHHELRLTAELCAETVPQALAQLDEPLADPGYLSVYYAASLASRHVKVVLAGDGGDELLCGYEPFKVWAAAEWLHRRTGPGFRRLLRRAVEWMPTQDGYMELGYRARVFLRGLDVEPALRNTYWLSAFTPEEGRAVLRHGHDLPPIAEGVRALHARTAAFDPLTRLGFEYQTTYLPHMICAHTDKANMRFSLEARSPFLDPSVVRWLNAAPAGWKLHGRQAKWILRRWIARRLGAPLPIQKRGFTVPVARWLRRELRPFAWQHLNPDALEAVGLFDPAVVQSLWRAHQAGRANHAKKLWTVLVAQLWCARQAPGPSSTPAPTIPAAAHG